VYLGDSETSPIIVPTSISRTLISRETMREEVAREALKEGLTPGLPMQEKTTKVPIQVEAADANVLPCIDVVM
jgi:hypothetical protein